MLAKTGSVTLDVEGSAEFGGDVQVNKLKVDGNIIEDNDGTDMITFDSSGNSTLAGTTTGTFVEMVLH